MYCKNCGMQIEDNSSICPICGTKQFDDSGDAIDKTKEIIDKIKTEASGPISETIAEPIGEIFDQTKEKVRKEVFEPNRKKIEKALINKLKRIAKKYTKTVVEKIGK